MRGKLHACVLQSHLGFLLGVQGLDLLVQTHHGNDQSDGDNQNDQRDGTADENSNVAVIAHHGSNEVCFHDVIQNHTQHQRSVIHVQDGQNIAEDQDGRTQHQFLGVAGSSISAGIAEHDDGGSQIGVADLNDLSHGTGQDLADGEQEDVGDQTAQDDGVSHGALLGEHRGARLDAVQNEGAQQQSGDAVTGDTQSQQGDHSAADCSIVCNFGSPDTACSAVEQLRKLTKERGLRGGEEVHQAFAEILTGILESGERELKLGTKPSVILMVGVNGVGKTTTIGKLAHYFKQQGKKVVLGAADTFRAAAVDQLTIWSERAGVEIVKQQMGSDPAAVAYDTVKSAVAKGADVVLIDTAGRLHNRVDLMNELTKIRNSVRKVVPDAPHDVMMILDASTGQNAFAQAKEFSRATDVTSITVTKLDGTAKGGVVVGVSDQFGIPVKFIGVGEGMEDIRAFDKDDFVETLFKPEEIHK